MINHTKLLLFIQIFAFAILRLHFNFYDGANDFVVTNRKRYHLFKNVKDSCQTKLISQLG